MYTHVNYAAILETRQFKAFEHHKKTFIIPITAFFLAFYMGLPLLAAFGHGVLNKPVFGAITLAWVYAFAQFVMTWTLCGIYAVKARGFDKLAQELRAEIDAEAGPEVDAVEVAR